METLRLYYDNAYLTEFDAVVVAAQERRIALNQSAFYPTSGGQPFDTGHFLWDGSEIKVTDVNVDNGVVWHTLSSPIPVGETLHGIINWNRRFDHMQQHAGDHMIAGALWELFQGVTIGLHTGSDVSTIDVAMPESKMHLTDEEINRLETLVNQRIQQNHPIRCWFPEDKELHTLPLRKKPTVSEHVRVVAMGDFEMVACGGTHPNTTGQIGLVKILSTAPSRGVMRLTFVAGMRAFSLFQAAYQSVREMGSKLSADIETAPFALQKLMDTQTQQQKESQARLTQAALSLIRSTEEIVQDARRYVCHLPFGDNAIMQQAAKALLQQENTLLFLSCPKDGGCLLLFARSADRAENMSELLRNTGARGGGKPDFAQGSAAAESVFALLP